MPVSESTSEARDGGGPPAKPRKRSRERELRMLEGALALFGQKGFEATTVAALCEAAGVSEATLYEYFDSKEQVLFAIAELYTQRELDRVAEVRRFIHDPREKLRAVIQAYLEFYERNPLYASVALLTLKANRNFAKSAAYEVVRAATRPILEAFREGVDAGLFRPDLDAFLVRNMVLGFIEHLTTQWIVLGRPERIVPYRDTVFEMVMRAIERPQPAAPVTLRIDLHTGATELVRTEESQP